MITMIKTKFMSLRVQIQRSRSLALTLCRLASLRRARNDGDIILHGITVGGVGDGNSVSDGVSVIVGERVGVGVKVGRGVRVGNGVRVGRGVRVGSDSRRQ